jgi:hypothetical protein
MGDPGFDLSTNRPTNGAFVLDPEGNNIEAVCHGLQQEA